MSDYTKVTEEEKAAVYNSIGYGRRAGKSRSEIAAATGLTDRTVRAAIHDLRVDGTVIVSIGGSGYFFPSKDEEVEQWLRIEGARVNSLLYAMSAAAAYINRQQVTLEEQE